MRFVLAFALLLAASCRAEDPKPRPDLTCRAPADCDVTHYTADCCVVCAWTPGTKAYVSALNAYCRAHPNPKCPAYDCPPMDPAVQCVKGACTLKAP